MKLPPDWSEFIGLLNHHRVRFLIVGAHALAVNGRPRATQDIDVWVAPTAANAKRLSKALREFGFTALADEGYRFAEPDRMATLGNPPLRIDIIEWTKGRLGFEDPQNRKEKAVERTAPMALWSYSLVIYWYAQWSRGRRELPFRLDPWNRTKKNPTFADMLATLRRESWTVWVSDRAVKGRFDRKHLEPLLEIAAYG